MAKIRFWKWQATDELGLPCPTRFRMPKVARKEPEPLELHPRSLEKWNLDHSRTNIAQGTQPK